MCQNDSPGSRAMRAVPSEVVNIRKSGISMVTPRRTSGICQSVRAVNFMGLQLDAAAAPPLDERQNQRDEKYDPGDGRGIAHLKKSEGLEVKIVSERRG